MGKGNFIISLDFELHWGAVEKWDLSLINKRFLNTRETIPKILELFEKYQIHATWATVGILFAKNKKQLLEFCPVKRPSYENQALYYYRLIENNEVGENEIDDPYHYAPSLIEKILATPHQELGSHTFAHYYCNEAGQNAAQFSDDLKAVQKISKENFGLELKSLVFPRNQFNQEYAEVASANGFKVVRSNPDVFFWKRRFFSKIAFLFRAIDTLFPISSTLTFKGAENKNGVVLLPASRFMRPYATKEKSIQNLKLKRIKSEMLYAAKKGRDYHIWWHPHNFGNFPAENVAYLEDILSYYKELNEKYEFSSKTMMEMSEL